MLLVEKLERALSPREGQPSFQDSEKQNLTKTVAPASFELYCLKLDHFLSETIEGRFLPGSAYHHIGDFGEGSLGIIDADMSIYKDVIATIGIDRKLKLWEFGKLKQLVQDRTLIDTPRSVTLHPFGFGCAVSFKDL